MKFNTLQRLTLLAFCSLALSGCGGVGGEPLNASTGAFILGNFGASLNTLPQSNNVPTLPIAGVTAGVFDAGTRSVNDCETVTPNPTTDADNDSIAAYKKYTYDCSGVVDNGYSYTRKGTVEIRDKDESMDGMYGGMRVDFDVPTFKSTSIASGTTYEYTYSGYWDYINQGGSLISKSSFTGSSKYQGTNNLQNDYTYTSTWDYKLTPKSTTAAWDEGVIVIEGSYVMNGKFIHEDSSGKHSQYEGSWAISYTTKDLTYKSGCTKFYNSGSFTISDNQNRIEIVYNCNDAKLYVNGSESDWWTP